MTRKDFEMMAGVIRQGREHNKRLHVAGVITLAVRIERDLALQTATRHMVEAFRTVNPRFDAERFHAACKID